MKLLDLRAFEGPSLHSDKPCVRITCAWPDVELPRSEFAVRAAVVLPPDKGWGRALDRTLALTAGTDPVSPAAAVGAFSSALQDERLGAAPTFQVFDSHVIVDAPEIPIAEHAARMAMELGRHCFSPEWSPAQESQTERLKSLRRRFMVARERIRLDFTSRVLLDAARARNVPVRIMPSSGNVLVLGRGAARRRLVIGMSDSTSAVAMRVIARDKHLTNDVLRRGGVAVPKQFWVGGADDVRRAVEALGFPLVVKGRTVDKGKAVTTDVRSMDDVRQAIEKVRPFNSDVLFEQQIDGDDFRMTVVGGRLVAAVRRTAAHVVGDGTSLIKELVAAENSRRSALGTYSHWLVPLREDDDSRAVLAGQGLSFVSAPEAGRVVHLRSVANISQGGMSEDVTDAVCADVRRAVERAAVLVGLDVTGVDVRTSDLSKSLEEASGAILEVNNFPALRAHYVTSTPPRDVAGAVIENLYADAAAARIPAIVAVGPWARDIVDAVAAAIAAKGVCVAAANGESLRIGDEPVSTGSLDAMGIADATLSDPRVDVAVFALSVADVEAAGFPWGDCSIAVLQATTETSPNEAEALSFVARCARDAVVVDVGLAEKQFDPGGAPTVRVSGANAAAPAVMKHLRPAHPSE